MPWHEHRTGPGTWCVIQPSDDAPALLAGTLRPGVHPRPRRAWLVRPERGRPYLEVEVWALDADGRPRILDGDALIEPARRTVWID